MGCRLYSGTHSCLRKFTFNNYFFPLMIQAPQTALNPLTPLPILTALVRRISAPPCLSLPHQKVPLLLCGSALSGITAFTTYLTSVASCAHSFLLVSSLFVPLNTFQKSFPGRGHDLTLGLAEITCSSLSASNDDSSDVDSLMDRGGSCRVHTVASRPPVSTVSFSLRDGCDCIL